MHIHASITLKVTYRYKKEIFGDDLGTSKYNIITWGPKNVRRDREGHKMCDQLGVVKSSITDAP